MKTCKIALGIVSTIALGMFIYSVRLQYKHVSERKLVDISDAGYETAHDVLYPVRYKKFKKR